MQILSWSAVVLLSTSYWFQIWKIHVHKEVRDLSMVYHVMLALGFGILTYTAYAEGSTIFIVKQIATTIPVVVIISQIFYHKNDHWHDDHDAICKSCTEELEPWWSFCAHCGADSKAPVATKASLENIVTIEKMASVQNMSAVESNA
jgi:hypothetical protein